MSVLIHKAGSSDDFQEIAELAKQIWEAHFIPLIGAAQVAYMLDRFQSAPAVSAQVEAGYEYHIFRQDGRGVGYFALYGDQLSKIYTHPDVRGGGTGYAMLEYARQLLRAQGHERIWLTVNKKNQVAIDFYTRNGFVISGSPCTDIGNGFVMDDYSMEASLAGEMLQGRCSPSS